MLKKLIFCSVVVVLFAGCSSPESVRDVNNLNGLAGKDVQERGEVLATHSDPAVQQQGKALIDIGTNIQAGAKVVEAELGIPEKPTVYTPPAHRGRIVDAQRDLEDKANMIDTVWSFAQTTAGKVTAAIGLGAIGVTVIGWLRSASRSAKLWEYAKLVGGIIGKSQDLQDEVAAKAQKKGKAAEIDKVVEMLPRPLVVTPATGSETPPVPVPPSEKPDEVVLVPVVPPPKP